MHVRATIRRINLANLKKYYQLYTNHTRLWSQGGTKVNRLHHGDILPRSRPWFGIETKTQLVGFANPATIIGSQKIRNIRQATENNMKQCHSHTNLLKCLRRATTQFNSEMLLPTPHLRSVLDYRAGKLTHLDCYSNYLPT